MDSARVTTIGAVGRRGPGCPACPRCTLPPSPPTDRADDATVSSSDLSEDAATTVSGETALSGGSTALTSPNPDNDLTKGTREIQDPKSIQEVDIEAPPRGERAWHEVAHALGGEGSSPLPRGYPLKLDLGAADSLPKPHSSCAYCCITDKETPGNNEAASSIKLGWRGEIPRWLLEQCLTYVVCKETFPTTSDGIHAAEQLAKAILMWENVGVTFKKVRRRAAANFRVVYSPQEHALAMAFFPNDGPPEARTLWICAPAFEPQYRNNQANFLAHEIGHILGLRHEFAQREEPRDPSIMWGNESPESVMEYYPDSSMWCVQQQDLDELESFYKASMTKYLGMVIRNYTAPRAKYPKAKKAKWYGR